MNDLAANYGNKWFEILDGVRRHGEIITVEHEEVSNLTGRKRTEIAFLE
jgi:hypothetical protein